jgi:predicted permease
MRKLFRRLQYILNRRRRDQDLSDEMAAHREMMPPERRAAFGSSLRLREASRDAWGWMWLDRLRQDLAYAVRMLWRSPAFTLTAVAVLALGAGANLAEFHIFNAIFVNRISLRDNGSLLQLVRHLKPDGKTTHFPAAAAEFYGRHSTELSYLVTENNGPHISNDDDDSVGLTSSFVSGNYFTALGVRPAIGRMLDPRDSDPAAPRVVVLGYGYWQQHFGADPSVIGRVLHLNGKPVQVVGVTPYNLTPLSLWSTNDTPLWFPASERPYLSEPSDPSDAFSRADTEIFVKLKPGMSPAVAEAQLSSLTAELHREQPREFQTGETTGVEPLATLPKLSPPAVMMGVLVLLVLIAACANLGNILLARGLARSQEIGIRVALGAGRWRVIRQLMTENLLLAVLGTAAGLWVGRLTALLVLHRMNIGPAFRVVNDWRIVLASAFLAVLSAIAFGLAPALQSVRPAPGAIRARQVLVGVQVAASCVLLILSSLITRFVISRLSIDARFDYNRMVAVNLYRTNSNFKGARARQTLDEIAARIDRLPGVDHVTSASIPPLGFLSNMIHLPNLPPVYLNDVAPSYFDAMAIPLVEGRTFRTAEQDAVIVSESAARAVWGKDDALGKLWDLGKETPQAAASQGPYTVVGVVKDSGANALNDSDSVEAYVSLGDSTRFPETLIVHTYGDPSALVRDIHAIEIRGVHPYAYPLRRPLDQQTTALHSLALIVGALGGTATLLAALGIFGLLAFSVAQRTREIGVRVALGARPPDILHLIARQYAVPLAAGGVAGIALAAAAGRVMQNAGQLPPDLHLDPAIYATGLAIFALVALAAALAPVLRALRINPATALRWE